MSSLDKLPEPENKLRYPALDGLRGIAVLMVFYEHYLTFKPGLRWGWAGVDIFFVLSGFLITGILYDTRNTEHRFRNFYMRRTLRIFPLYYGVLLVGLALDPIFHWVRHPSWYLWPLYLENYGRFIWLSDFLKGTGILDHLRSSLPFHPPFFMRLGHFWSLAVEEQFYLLWPMVVYFIKDRVKLRNTCVAICLLSLAARIACAFMVPQRYLDAELLYRLTPLRADALLLGGLIALMLRGPEARFLKKAAQPVLYLFVIGFIVFETVYAITIHRSFHPGNGIVLGTIGYTLVDIFAGIVILISLDSSSILYRIFTIKPLRNLGKISYGFYVFHDIPHGVYILLVVRVLGHDSTFTVALIAFAATLILSFLSFRYFESPFLKLKDHFTPNRLK
jgi:peptidoglycan/LPS O-acetylase OafA/YrhL